MEKVTKVVLGVGGNPVAWVKVPRGTREVVVVNAVSVDGYPVNRETMKVSGAARMLSRATDEWLLDEKIQWNFRGMELYVDPAIKPAEEGGI